jgi:hypothetical protein
MTATEPPVCADCDYAIPLAGEPDRLVCLIELGYCTADRPATCGYFRLPTQGLMERSLRVSVRSARKNR